jgi:hypothetical protein
MHIWSSVIGKIYISHRLTIFVEFASLPIFVLIIAFFRSELSVRSISVRNRRLSPVEMAAPCR